MRPRVLKQRASGNLDLVFNWEQKKTFLHNVHVWSLATRRSPTHKHPHTLHAASVQEVERVCIGNKEHLNCHMQFTTSEYMQLPCIIRSLVIVLKRS